MNLVTLLLLLESFCNLGFGGHSTKLQTGSVLLQSWQREYTSVIY